MTDFQIVIISLMSLTVLIWTVILVTLINMKKIHYRIGAWLIAEIVAASGSGRSGRTVADLPWDQIQSKVKKDGEFFGFRKTSK